MINSKIPKIPDYRGYCDKLAEWDPEEFFKRTMKEHKAFSMILTGSSKSGKSNMLRYILDGPPKVSKYFDFILIFSRTLINGFYQSFLDTTLLFGEFDGKILEDMKKLYEKKKGEGKTFKWLVILDDVVNNKSKYIKEITDLFFVGRHIGASIVFLTQKMSLMNTGWSANCSVIITLFAGARNEKNYIANNVIADVIDESFSDYAAKNVERIAYLIHSNVCQDFQALIILPYEKNGRIFKFKAKLMEKTKKKPKSLYESLMTH